MRSRGFKKVPEALQRYSSEFQGVSIAFQGASGVFQSFRDVPVVFKRFQRCSRKLQRHPRGVPEVFQRFQGRSMEFQGRCRVQGVSSGSFQDISADFSTFKYVLRVFKEFQGHFREFQGLFRGFQGLFMFQFKGCLRGYIPDMKALKFLCKIVKLLVKPLKFFMKSAETPPELSRNYIKIHKTLLEHS